MPARTPVLFGPGQQVPHESAPPGVFAVPHSAASPDGCGVVTGDLAAVACTLEAEGAVAVCCGEGDVDVVVGILPIESE